MNVHYFLGTEWIEDFAWVMEDSFWYTYLSIVREYARYKIRFHLTIVVHLSKYNHLIVLIGHQESNIGLRWWQLLPSMFIVGIGLGFVVVPLNNIIISRTKLENVGPASGVLNTMMAVGNAIIGSLFFGMIGVSTTSAASDIGNHFNGSNIKIHHYTDALINSILCSIGVVIVTFLLVFLLPSIRPRKQSSEHENQGSISI